MNEFERLQNGIEKFGKIATIQVDWRMSNHGKDIERDKILTAQQALEYGLIDQVLTTRKA